MAHSQLAKPSLEGVFAERLDWVNRLACSAAPNGILKSGMVSCPGSSTA